MTSPSLSFLKLIILDCDGVLYPDTELSLRTIIEGMKKTFEDWQFSSKLLEEASAESRPFKGVFNYIACACKLAHKNEHDFCKAMVDNIPYNAIKPNLDLLEKIQKMRAQVPVCVLTNNHAFHLERVFKQVFQISPAESGIPCYDITSMSNGKYYLSKQSDAGLKTFCAQRNILPCDSLLLDDTQRNIDAAKNIGMNARLVTVKQPLLVHLSYIQSAIQTPLRT